MNINLLDAIKEMPFVKHVIFFSSYRCFSSTNHMFQEEPMSDNFNLTRMLDENNAGYLLSKIVLELQIKLLSKNSNIIINNLYLPNIFGDFDYFNEDSRIIPSLIFKIFQLKQHNQTILTKECHPNINVNLLYVDDLIKIIEIIIERNMHCGNLILYDSQNTFTLHSLIDILKNKIYPDLNVLFTQQANTSILPHYNNDKFNQLFPGWIFTSINKSLDETIEHYLINYK